MNDLTFLLLLGMMLSFGALVVPRYGQTMLFLVGSAVLMFPPCPDAWEGIAALLLLLVLSFVADFFFARRGAWKPRRRDAVMGAFPGFAAGCILTYLFPLLFPLVGSLCFIGALVTAMRTARKQNAPVPAVRTHLVGCSVRLLLGVLMVGIVLATLFS